MITCNVCKVDKDLDQFDKHKHGKHGKRTICKSCQAIKAKEYRLKKPDFIKELKDKYRNSFDGFLVTILGDARRRAEKSKIPFEIDLDFLKSLWDTQFALCKFTGLPLEYIKVPGKNKNPYQASLDRIDSRGGYTKDNVRWVCWFINEMKMDYSEEEFIHLIKQANSTL